MLYALAELALIGGYDAPRPFRTQPPLIRFPPIRARTAGAGAEFMFAASCHLYSTGVRA